MAGTADIARALADEELPVVVVDLDAFDRNLDRHGAALARVGLPLRVATKSLRVPRLIERVLARPFARGLLCYAAREVEALAARGLDDLFLAYPPWSARDFARLAAVTAAGRRVTVAVDSFAAAECASAAGAEAGVRLRVALCADMSLRALGGRVHLGVRRSPLHSVDEVVSLADRVATLPRVELVGLIGYEAQVAGLGDAAPHDPGLVQVAKRAFRQVSMRELAARRAAMVEALARRGHALQLVNGGGTGSLELTTAASGVSEVSAGSGLFKPTLFDGYAGAFVRSLEPACFFALEVRRRAARDVVTCFGGGYVASGAFGRDKLPVPVWPEGLSLLPAEGPGEVQTPLAGSAARRLAPGDVVLFRHAKAGEPMERFAEVLLVSGGRVVERAPTYRGAGFSFG